MVAPRRYRTKPKNNFRLSALSSAKKVFMGNCRNVYKKNGQLFWANTFKLVILPINRIRLLPEYRNRKKARERYPGIAVYGSSSSGTYSSMSPTSTPRYAQRRSKMSLG